MAHPSAESDRAESPQPPVALRRRRQSILVVLALAAVTTASAGGYGWVRVHQGDTLSRIATKHHTTVSELVALNHLQGNGDLIIAGSRLRVPERGTHHAGAHHTKVHHARRRHVTRHAKQRSNRASGLHWVVSHYKVRNGDSVDGIANRWNVPASRIATANHLPKSHIIELGAWIRIPHWSHHIKHRAASTGSVHTASTVDHLRAELAHRSEPSQLHIERMIVRTAKRFRVDPAFALGISWQESGFNQRVVSGVGAIGAMQVMPASGQFVSTYVTHRPLNLLRARDNIEAGIGLLSVLLTDTHHNRRLAAAGYYQGLASVRAKGEFRDTKRYVADVISLRRHFAG